MLAGFSGFMIAIIICSITWSLFVFVRWFLSSKSVMPIYTAVVTMAAIATWILSRSIEITIFVTAAITFFCGLQYGRLFRSKQ